MHGAVWAAGGAAGAPLAAVAAAAVAAAEAVAVPAAAAARPAYKYCDGAAVSGRVLGEQASYSVSTRPSWRNIAQACVR